MPVTLTASFTVAHTDAAGYGVTNVDGPGIAAVYMHTTQTPAAGSPNPAAGFIMVKLQDNYNSIVNSIWSLTSPNSGTNVGIGASALTVGELYVITVVGTSTLADWQAVGLPKGLTPTVGQAFIAIATGAGSGTGEVQTAATAGSGLNHIETVGLVNTENAPWANPQGPLVPGAYIFGQCLAPTNSTTTTLVPTAPADGTIIQLKLFLENSSAKAGAAGQ